MEPSPSATAPGTAGGPAHDGVPEDAPTVPEVALALVDDVARLTIAGELTEAARRPLVRELTDLLLTVPALRRVELDVRDVNFLNSAGIAVLVQLQRMSQPRGVELVLVEPPAVVVRPLHVTGLWHRFEVLDPAELDDTGDDDRDEPYRPLTDT